MFLAVNDSNERASLKPRSNPMGRPAVTTHAKIERVALRLFAVNGFDETTLDDIATELGVGKRTLFRYFPSKNDIPWGQFEQGLDAFRQMLGAMPTDIPMCEAIYRCVVNFNDFDDDALPQHRQRMLLILNTAALQAHSVLQYAKWRRVVAEFVAGRLDLSPTDLLPRAVGHASLAMSLAAYEVWLTSEDQSLQDLLDQALSGLRQHFAS